MARRAPEGPPPAPVVQRVRLRYAKRGRLRFTSHRDFARAFERALRRAGVPMAYSAGFTPHPKISYVGAAPTGTASEAELVEIGLREPVDLDRLRGALNQALPDGLDIVDAVRAGPGSLADRVVASTWRISLSGVGEAELGAALDALLSRPELLVARLTKAGRRMVDVRAALVTARVQPIEADGAPAAGAPVPVEHDAARRAVVGATRPASGDRAIMVLVVRQVIPAVRPDDVLAALHIVAGLAPEAPPIAVRMAQGPLDDVGVVGDPLAPDRSSARASSSQQTEVNGPR